MAVMAVDHAPLCDTGFVLSNPEAIKERNHGTIYRLECIR